MFSAQVFRPAKNGRVFSSFTSRSSAASRLFTGTSILRWINLLRGAPRKAVDLVASGLGLFALGLLFTGGIHLVLQTADTWSVATNVNMALINGTLPIMAFVAFIIHARDFIRLVRRPAADFGMSREG